MDGGKKEERRKGGRREGTKEGKKGLNDEESD